MVTDNFMTDGRSGVWICMEPEYTIGDFRSQQDDIWLDRKSKSHIFHNESTICQSVVTPDGQVSIQTSALRSAVPDHAVSNSGSSRLLQPLSDLRDLLAAAGRCIEGRDVLWWHSQFRATQGVQLFSPQKIMQAGALYGLSELSLIMTMPLHWHNG